MVSVGVIWHIQLSMPFLFVMVQLCFCNKGKDLPDATRKNRGTRKKPSTGTDDGVKEVQHGLWFLWFQLATQAEFEWTCYNSSS